jgi:hypothetical protein
MTIKEKIQQMLALPDEIWRELYWKIQGGVSPYDYTPYDKSIDGAKEYILNIVPLFEYLESKLPKDEPDLIDLRRSVSQCTTVEYCKGWNDAIKAVQEQQNRVDKNIEEANEALRKRVEPVNPELYKAMVREKDLDEIYWGNCEPFIDDEEATVFLMTDDGFKQAVAELQQPKFPSDEEIMQKIEELGYDVADYGYFRYDKDSLIKLANWLKGGNNGK